MNNKILILLFLTCLVISPALAYDLQWVSITEGGDQFVSIPFDKTVIYSYSSDIPQNGLLILSLPDNDTYLLDSGNSIEMITISKRPSTSIIDTIFWWL